MGGKTAMATALTYPDLVERLVVVDVSPLKVHGSRESSELISALKRLDVASMKSRREADFLLKRDIEVLYIP